MLLGVRDAPHNDERAAPNARKAAASRHLLNVDCVRDRPLVRGAALAGPCRPHLHWPTYGRSATSASRKQLSTQSAKAKLIHALLAQPSLVSGLIAAQPPYEGSRVPQI